MHGPDWFGPDGTGEHWWGTRTTYSDRNNCGTGAGRPSNSRSVVCHATGCVRIAADNAWGQIAPHVAAQVPEIETSPPDAQSLVQIATWFWHDQWESFTATAEHPSAPTTVEATATPVRTWWDYGQGDEFCNGRPQPFDHSLLTQHVTDPDGYLDLEVYELQAVITR